MGRGLLEQLEAQQHAHSPVHQKRPVAGGELYLHQSPAIELDSAKAARKGKPQLHSGKNDAEL